MNYAISLLERACARFAGVDFSRPIENIREFTIGKKKYAVWQTNSSQKATSWAWVRIAGHTIEHAGLSETEEECLRDAVNNIPTRADRASIDGDYSRAFYGFEDAKCRYLSVGSGRVAWWYEMTTKDRANCFERVL